MQLYSRANRISTVLLQIQLLIETFMAQGLMAQRLGVSTFISKHSDHMISEQSDQTK